MKRILLLLLLIPLFAKAQINTNGVISMGRNALYYEDYVLSIQYFNQVIDAKPYLYEPYYYRAVAKYYLGDYVGAVNDCNASIERDPFIDNCFRLRAISQVMTGSFKEAAADYQTLINRQNNDKDTWYNLVLCKSQLKEFDAADLLLDTMIIKWPKYARCYMLKAQISLERKDTATVEKLVDQVLQIDSFDVDALAAKAMLSMSKDSFYLAELFYDKAIIQAPRRSNYFLGRAFARYQQRKLRGAMDDYNVALDLTPDNYPAHYNRGLLRMQVGENNLAIEDFDFVLAKDPHDRLALYNRATLLEKIGDYRAAIADYTAVLKDYPNFITGYENRARCRRKIGDTSNALKDERKVLVSQLDATFGTKKPARRSTRKPKEQNIEEYKNFVAEEESDNIANFYSNDYRGRVQNRTVDTQPQSLYLLTFNVKGSDIMRYNNYATFVDALNEHKLFERKLYLATREAAASTEDLDKLDAEHERLTKSLGKSSAKASELFALACIASAKRDYVTAISSLDQALHKDSLYEAALFLRAVVKACQLETQDNFQEQPTTLVSSNQNVQMGYLSSIEDLTKAIQIDPSCAFLYYNRACLYQKMKQTDRALQDYSQAIALKDDMAEAYYNRGLLNVQQSDYNQAYFDFGKAGELGLYSAYSLIKHFRKQQNQKK